MTAFRWAQAGAIAIGLVPLAAVVWEILRGRKPDPDAILLVCAFAISAITGWMDWQLRANGHETLWLTYVVIPVQFAVIMSVVQPREHQRIVWLFYGLLVAVSWAGADQQSIEMGVHVVAGAWIALVAYRQPAVAPYRAALVLYCGATIPFLLALGFQAPRLTAGWIMTWTGYQTVRLIALTLMAYAVVAEPRTRMEVVTDEPRDHRAAGRVRRARRGAGHARHRDRVAVPR
jgi:hypothetical protein